MRLFILSILLLFISFSTLAGQNPDTISARDRSSLDGDWYLIALGQDSGWVMKPVSFYWENGVKVSHQEALRVGFWDDTLMYFDYIIFPSDPYLICGSSFGYFDAEYKLDGDTLYLIDKETRIPEKFFGDYICKFLSDSVLYLKKFRTKPSEYSVLLNQLLYTHIEELDEKERNSILNMDTISFQWTSAGDSLLMCKYDHYLILSLGLSEDRKSTIVHMGDFGPFDLAEMVKIKQYAQCESFIVSKPRRIYESYYTYVFEFTLENCASAEEQVFYLVVYPPW